MSPSLKAKVAGAQSAGAPPPKKDGIWQSIMSTLAKIKEPAEGCYALNAITLSWVAIGVILGAILF